MDLGKRVDIGVYLEVRFTNLLNLGHGDADNKCPIFGHMYKDNKLHKLLYMIDLLYIYI